MSPIDQYLNKNTDLHKYKSRGATIAGGINISKPINGMRAIKVLKDTGGGACSVSEEEIFQSQKLLATEEGIGTEPTGAVVLAGLKKLIDNKKIQSTEIAVCILTGHALKDTQIIMKTHEKYNKAKPNVREILNTVSLLG